jgi:hypothetical protein
MHEQITIFDTIPPNDDKDKTPNQFTRLADECSLGRTLVPTESVSSERSVNGRGLLY